MIQARANQAVPVKSIGAVVQGPLNIVLSLKEKNIASPKDLAGKTVGYAGTELSEVLVRSIMEDVGADSGDVAMVDVGFDLMSSMTTGSVDATIGCLKNHEVPQLIEEGFVYEIISKIQTMRKDADFEVMDHIRVSLNGNEKVAQIAAENEAVIAGKVLAESIGAGRRAGGFQRVERERGDRDDRYSKRCETKKTYFEYIAYGQKSKYRL